MISEIMEILMVVSFGISWPLDVIKSFRARTARGKSLFFLLLIFIGYLCGIAGKLLGSGYHWYVLFFYVLNAVMVGADILLYFRNRRLDRQSGPEQEAPALQRTARNGQGKDEK